jgi:hypothetical protein
MATDYLPVGPTPTEEDCEQVGPAMDRKKERFEAAAFARQVARHYPPPALGAVRVKSFQHDFGSYSEVCVVYVVGDEESESWAFSVETDDKDVLQRWDAEARKELDEFAATRHVE